MAHNLHIAAVKGDVPYLLELLAKDKLLLKKTVTENQGETPLHIAAMLGHLDFVEEVLAQKDEKDELTKARDSQGSTPLHLAAAKGYLNIVVSLLRVDPDVCDLCDRYDRNPLHVVAMKGHVDVLEYLVQKRPDAAHSSVKHKQPILHLCVMHNRLEALKFLIDILPSDLINSKDQGGNTILHLAAKYGETKTMLFLTNKGVKPNNKNSRGFTALDLLAQGESEERKRKWQNNMHKTLIVVATLLATMAFQASITPPGGHFQGNSPSGANTGEGKSTTAAPPGGLFEDANTGAGKSIMANENMEEYTSFIACNTISFIASFSIIMIFISGLPLKRHRITTWITMLVMWVAITFMAVTYVISISFITPPGGLLAKAIAIIFGELSWVVLMVFLSLCHFIRLILKLVRKVRDFVREGWTGGRPEGQGGQRLIRFSGCV